MLPCSRLSQVILRSQLHNLSAMFYEVFQHSREGEHLRHAVYESEHIVVEGALQFRMFIQSIQNGLRVCGAL